MITTLMVIHAICSALLVLMVLLQFGKGAEAGFISGAGSDQVFSGATKGNILTHITTFLAVMFLGLSIVLAKMQSKSTTTSIMDDEAPVSRPLNQDAAKAPVVPTEEKKPEVPVEKTK